jgi:two-component system chemotaxis sensor kinase CheA
VNQAKDPYRYFRGEARELLHGLSEGILALERGEVGREHVGNLLRLVHTLKGAARVVKLAELARMAHALEDLLVPYRERGGPVARPHVDDLLRLLDEMGSQLAKLDAAPTPEAGQAGVRRTAPRQALDTVRVEVEEMDRLLEGVTEATVQLNGLRRASETMARAKEIATTLAELLAPSRRADASDLPSRASALAEELRDCLARLHDGVASAVGQVSRELSQVREAADRLRLLPASVIFGPLERAVRDAATQGGKKVSFEATGGEGRIEAHVLAAVHDALLHVVRNAAAHGIESEQERARAGKSAVGIVRLEVERRGSKIAFTCHDDGRGIDVNALRREAVRTGALSPSAASATTDDDLFRILLQGGLSTTSTVTEVSGRGIGLDVVRETASRLQGSVTIRSEAGLGTRLELCVPVSLSSFSVLVVEAGGVSAVLPLDAVTRTIRLDSSEIAHTPTGDSIVQEGVVIPFAPLAKALRRPTGPARGHRIWSTVIVRSGEARAAFGVDRLLGTATAVVRPLPPHVEADPLVAGASLDAEGVPRLVLDANGLILAVETGRSAAEAAGAPALPILVVDDSLTTRMLEQSILESAGYEVVLASSAEEGLVKATERRYALFLVDVEMPGMDGFDFVARTRADVTLRDTPAILVTSRSAPEDRRKGESAGARGYIVKGEFDQRHLLDVIRKLVG